MTAAMDTLARVVAFVGSAAYAAAGSVLGSPPVPPVAVTWPDVVWVVVATSRNGTDRLSAWPTPGDAEAARHRAFAADVGSDLLCVHVHRCVVGGGS